MVAHAHGQDVETVIVDGEIMMENRIMLHCDEQRILDDAAAAQSKLFERLGPEKMKKYTTYPGLYDIQSNKVD